MNATSAMPIVSAAAVTIVRPGDAPPGDQRTQRTCEERHDAVAASRALAATAKAHPQPAAAQQPDDQHHEREATDEYAEDQDDHEADEEADDQEPARRKRSRRDLDALAHRGDRRHARRAQGRGHPGEHGDEDPDEQRDDDRAGLQDGAVVGDVGAEELEQLVERGCETDAGEQPEHRAEHAEQQPFADDGLQDLPSRGAEHAQQREFTRALRDGDRERVEDYERANDERDVGEDEQERAQEAEVFFQVGGVLFGLLGTGADVDGARQRGTDPRAQLFVGDAGRGGDVDLVEAAGLADDTLGLREREQRDAGAAEGFAAAELDDAHDRVVLGGGAPGDDDLLPDLDVRAFGGRLVDRDFARLRRKMSLDRLERLEARRHDGRDEPGGVSAGEPFALGIEERAFGEDAPGRLGDAGRRADAREHLIGDRRGL
jgi:hypothetical protein